MTISAADSHVVLTAEALPQRPEMYEYHRLARVRPRYNWGLTLVTGIVAVALYVVLMLMILVPVGVTWMLTDPIAAQNFDQVLSTTAFFDLDQPLLLAVLVVPLILMIPALFLATRMVQGRGVGFLSSVAGRLRWGWLGQTLLLAVGVYAVYFGITLAISAINGDTIKFDASHSGIPLMLLLVIALVPLQAAAEEYVFRGYLMQLIGGWLKHPAFAILLPAPIFVLGHGYDIWAGLSTGVFAVVAAWMSWRTGGLEAAISMHIVNNVLIFALGSFSLVNANASTGTPIDLLGSAVMMVAFALIVDRWARARGLARTTAGG